MNRNKNIMTLGVELTAPTPEPDKYKHDLIHPSVKYIEGGFAGHDWWMVATPYYQGKSSIENPILYYGDSREGGLPPLTWTPIAVVEDTPPQGIGYNSDGCIYYDGAKLWVFWRENATLATIEAGYRRATFGVSTTDGYTFSNKKLYAGELTDTEDSEMCPIVVKFDGKIKLYGCHYEFKPKRQPRGLAIWDLENNDLENKAFSLTKTVGQLYYGGFNFWHFDVFRVGGGTYYCVVTPESGNEILLGTSEDGENFKFWSTPLLSTSVSGANYLYKPCAMVKDGVFYLWHPKRMADGTNKIFMSEIDFSQLLTSINDTKSIIS